MKQRAEILRGLRVAGRFVLALLAVVCFGTVNGWAQRIAFTIATGPSNGTYFPAGELIAGVVSHPAGADRCSRVSACGPDGLIATAQTSAGSYENALFVNSGRVDSALAHSDAVAQAVRGIGAFRGHPQTHLRVIAAMFPEQIHLVARVKSHIGSVNDLRGKRICIGAHDSGTALTAHTILDAYGAQRVHFCWDAPASAAQKLQAGKIDAFFFVGAAPIPLVEALISSGQAVLIPITGPVAERLAAQGEGLSAATIPGSAYGYSASVQTLGLHTMWIVNDQEPDDVVFSLTRALFDSENRDQLRDGLRDVQLIEQDRAPADLPAPLHPGAERYYKSARPAQYMIQPR
jgi:TRAP transporter TAXI family solute receptor